MRYLTLQGGFEELKREMEKEQIPFEDTGKYLRFHSFTSNAPVPELEKLVSSVFGREESIPVVHEEEFKNANDTRTFFMGRHAHVIALV